MAEEITVEEALHRNAKALIAMDFGRLMADLTPEAMVKAMALGGAMMQQLTEYQVLGHTQDGEDHIFELQYTGPSANITGGMRWRRIDGTWKVVDFWMAS